MLSLKHLSVFVNVSAAGFVCPHRWFAWSIRKPRFCQWRRAIQCGFSTFEQGTRTVVTEKASAKMHIPYLGILADVLHFLEQTISGLLFGLPHVETLPSDKCTSTGSAGPFLHADAPFSALGAEPCCAKIQVKASYLGPKTASCNEPATSPSFAASYCLGTNRSDVRLPPQATSGLSLCRSGSLVCCLCWPSPSFTCRE